MKIKIFSTLLLALIMTGCQKKSNQPVFAGTTGPVVKAQFEQSNDKIHQFLDQLDDPNTPQDTRIQILCKDYSTEYKTNYMPSLMKLSPDEYTEGKLIKDLYIALDYYKSNFNVKC